MIKNLSKKMLISMFLLVVSIIITSSCFATTTTYKDFEIEFDRSSETLEIKNTKYDVSVSYDLSDGFDYFKDVNNYSYYFQVNSQNDYSTTYDEVYNFGFVLAENFEWEEINSNLYAYGSKDNVYGYYFGFYVRTKSNGEVVGEFKLTWNETPGFEDDSSYIRGAYGLRYDINSNDYAYEDTEIICSNNNIDNPSGEVIYSSKYIKSSYKYKDDGSAIVSFELNSNLGEPIVLSDYSLYYSLTGVEPQLSLTEELKLRNPIRYYIGTSSLTVKTNSKVYYALYDKNNKCIEQDYIYVPKYDAVKENSDKDIDYEIEYNSDNTEATIYASITNGEFSDKLYYSYYPPDLNGVYEAKLAFPRSGLKITKNCDIYLIATDAFDNVFTADYATINKLGTFPEDLFKVNVLTEEKTVMLYPRLYGFDFDKYYIEVSANLDHFSSSDKVSFYINNDKKGDVKSLNGEYFQVGSNAELKFYQSVGTSEITVTFLIKNEETDAICLTRTVSFKIGLKGNDDTGIIGSTTNGVEDDSFLISDSDSVVKSIENMTLSDYYKLVDTGNSAWYFFKVILNSLPSWLTLPLSLLIFGVVVITLYRFIRGA